MLEEMIRKIVREEIENYFKDAKNTLSQMCGNKPSTEKLIKKLKPVSKSKK